MVATLSERRASGFTCIGINNLRGSDCGVMPTPVHIACWEERDVSGGYQRVMGAKRFIVAGEWTGPSLPAGAVCWFCREIV